MTCDTQVSLSLGCVTLVVRDYDEAIDFFTRVMGFSVVEDTSLSEVKRWVVVSPGANGTRLLLARAATPAQEDTIGKQTGGRVAFFLHTDDFHETYEGLRARGVTFVEAPRIEPYGTVAVFLDVYGNRWDLIEPVESIDFPGDVRERRAGIVTELVRCFDRMTAYIHDLVADLPDEAIVLQPPGAPNHPAWTLGHIIHSWQAMAGELGAAPWLRDDWETLFGYGSSPDSVVGSAYASRAILAPALADAADRLRTALLRTVEGSLSEPLPDPQARDVLPTKADAILQVVVAHTAYHAGQLAAWRRATGRAPVGVFI